MNTTFDPSIAARTDELSRQQHARLCADTTRLFAWLMLLQWIFGIVAAMVISPQTWIGGTSHVHVHIWAAVFLGGAISSLPWIMARRAPASPLTRHVIAVAQMLWSALLIHLTGGRIETHFHVFGSLAILAFYRDWKVLVTATVVVAADHLIRGVFWPQSVFGVFVESPYRWIEHSAWVAFEVLFLVLACRRSVREMQEICRRQAILESTNERIESEVARRTEDLNRANELARKEISDRKQAEAERHRLQQQLLDVARQAGMAEVATGVLHNVGNVLNSVNVSASLLSQRLAEKHWDDLARAIDLLLEHVGDLNAYVQHDPRGRHLPDFLRGAVEQLRFENQENLHELDAVSESVSHINHIIQMQQAHARMSGVREEVRLENVIEDALTLSAARFVRHSIQIIREYEVVPRITIERHRLLQILVNLLANAKDALAQSPETQRRIAIRLRQESDDSVCIDVEDNGIGIAEESLLKIFSCGFTTKRDGHGFGLHHSALAAQSLGGSLSVHSDGPQSGATFTLTLPVTADVVDAAPEAALQLAGAGK